MSQTECREWLDVEEITGAAIQHSEGPTPCRFNTALRFHSGIDGLIEVVTMMYSSFLEDPNIRSWRR